MWPVASKLARLRPLGRASNFQRIQYYNLITRGLAISPDFAEIFPAYVEANGGNAVVPNKLVKTPENEAKHAAWSEIHKSAAAFRKRYLDQTLSQEDFEQLEAMGFVWFRSEWAWEKQIVPGLVAYKAIHGNLEVPYSFVVPASEGWPERLHGFRLGNAVHSIRSRQSHVEDDPERRQWLDNMGFVWDDLERQWEVAKEALATYKQLHGDLEVPWRFVVPESKEWPEEMWGTREARAHGEQHSNVRLLRARQPGAEAVVGGSRLSLRDC